MNHAAERKKSDSPQDFGAITHEVLNQPYALENYNLFAGDAPLREAIKREGADWAQNELGAFGEKLGRGEFQKLGEEANHYQPEFDTHDRYGRRVDLVRFHPAYHQLMKTSIEQGLHSSPWTEPRPGAHVARAGAYYMMAQIEAGHGCPITMTFASVPALSRQPDLAREWLPKITARVYDPRNVPVAEKQGATIGMAMTEKQGGSDVRANTTRAMPLGAAGPGQLYELVGHKFFVSAPMCDAFLVLAQAPGGLSCFLLPRWLPDGSKNPMQVLRLKKKSANVSNASSETELRGALAWMVGEEGRGVPTIIDMVAMTRFDCMIGSSAGMRMAAAQAIDHCKQRSAFGAKLIDQPLMINVLADIALESEAALAMTMRLARALDNRADPFEDRLVRLMTAIGKYWICKRAPGQAMEAMECVGGSGVMLESPLQRIYREAPINAIWEGSGNVQCLDALRAIKKEPETLDVFFAEMERSRGADARLDQHIAALKEDMRDRLAFESRGRNLMDRLALGFQGATLARAAPNFITDAFCAARLAHVGAHQYGVLPSGCEQKAILARAAAR